MSSRAASRSEMVQKAGQPLLVANAVGALIYLVRVSDSWRDQPELPITGEPFVWFGALLPIAAIFLPLNAAWGAFIVRFRQWQSGRLWMWTALLWIVAIAIDFAHH